MEQVPDLPDDDSWMYTQRQAIGARIRAERRRQQLTQDEVWIAAGLTRWTYQRAEYGEDIKLSTLQRIARVLGVPLAELAAVE
ncbi:helix-turn-helix domain-containing protein [Streptomyces griseorubiginosus]|uniref:helix-turn-helix domain-containing protein n=1 Tax=Streptomyces griseorubiginosus TaxID=67304 RepID=UPI0036E9E7B2